MGTDHKRLPLQPKYLCDPLFSQAFEGSFLCGEGLLFPFYTGLLITLPPPELCQDTCFFAFLSEAFHCHLKGFIFPHPDTSHLLLSPPSFGYVLAIVPGSPKNPSSSCRIESGRDEGFLKDMYISPWIFSGTNFDNLLCYQI